MHRILAATILVVALVAPESCAAQRQRFTMLVDIDGRAIEGMPLAWSDRQVFLLARDGRLWEFPPNKATNFRKTSSSFTSYSAAQIRAGLERELAVLGSGGLEPLDILAITLERVGLVELHRSESPRQAFCATTGLLAGSSFPKTWQARSAPIPLIRSLSLRLLNRRWVHGTSPPSPSSISLPVSSAAKILKQTCS